MRKVVVIGVGMTKFGKFPELPPGLQTGLFQSLSFGCIDHEDCDPNDRTFTVPDRVKDGLEPSMHAECSVAFFKN